MRGGAPTSQSVIRGGWGWVGQAGSKVQAHLQAAGYRLVSDAVQLGRAGGLNAPSRV